MSSPADFFNAEAVSVAFAFRDRLNALKRSNDFLSKRVAEYQEESMNVRGELADEKKRHAATLEASHRKSLTIEKLKAELDYFRLLRQEDEKAKAHNARLSKEISEMRETIRFQAMAIAGFQKVISLFKGLHPESAMFQITRHKDKKGNKLVHWVHMYNQAFDDYGRTHLKISNPEKYREAP